MDQILNMYLESFGENIEHPLAILSANQATNTPQLRPSFCTECLGIKFF